MHAGWAYVDVDTVLMLKCGVLEIEPKSIFWSCIVTFVGGAVAPHACIKQMR
jgi:hypothetical protein